MMPLVWIFLTGFKTPPDSIAYPPKVVFEPSLEGYCNLFTTRSRQTPEFIRALPPPQGLCDEIARAQHGDRRAVELRAALRQFADHRLRLDLLAVVLGTLSAYGFSRFKRAAGGRSAVLHPVDADDAADRGRDPDLPDVPRARAVGHQARHDPALHRGQRLARGLAAEGLHRRDPARVRGGGDDRRLHALQAFFKVVLPQATTGIAATAIFCLIFAWNEYAFAVLLTSGERADRAALHPDHHRRGRQDWPAVAAGTTLVPGADPRVHGAAAQASAARHHLRSGAQMSLERHQTPRARPSRTEFCGAARWKPSRRRSSPSASSC
jgi:multiple sugar transport system permease protein